MTAEQLSQPIPELQEILLDRGDVRIERIVSRGHSSAPGFWYDQTDNEWVIVLSGNALVLLDGDGEPIALGPGDHLNIPAHVRHRVEWTDPERDTVWLAVFYK